MTDKFIIQIHKPNKNSMVHTKIISSTMDNMPVCHSSFFRNDSSEQFIEIGSCKSFSKSNEKKLKLISDRRSLQKSTQFLQQKRKIKPLNLKVAFIKQEQRAKKMLCSIKGFKEKINKLTSESNLSSNMKITTLNTDISQNAQNTSHKTNNASNQNSRFYIYLNSKELVSNQTIDPFPTLGNSLVVQESTFNPDSLLQSHQVTNQSNQISFQNSPTNKIFQNIKNDFATPVKIKMQQQDLSTRVSFRKQKISLNNARKVQTFQTLRTQNQICYSVAEENQYKRFFDNIAFPDYFSNKQHRRSSHDKQKAINKNFKLQTHPAQLY